jgi:hypothetical protein
MDGERLRRDVFPAELLLPDGGVVTEARVFVTTHRLFAWTYAHAKVQVAADIELAEHDSVPGNRGTLQGSLAVETTQGTVYVNKGRGCGCHSPLRALAPPVGWTREGVTA